MSEQSTIDRSQYTMDDEFEAPFGFWESHCPTCKKEGLYLGMNDALRNDDVMDQIIVIGWYPIYACDDCHLIWFGRDRPI